MSGTASEILSSEYAVNAQVASLTVLSLAATDKAEREGQPPQHPQHNACAYLWVHKCMFRISYGLCIQYFGI